MLKKIIIIFVVIFLFSVLFWRSLNSPADKNGRPQAFTVSQGETAGQVARNLKNEKIIKSIFYFNYLIKKNKLSLKAGNYSVSPALSAKEIIKILSDGQAINQDRTIKIIEGWNLRDINKYLNNNKIIPADDFLKLAGRAVKDLNLESTAVSDIIDELPPSANLEGFLFPDTYRVDNQAQAAEIIEMMLGNFDNKLTASMKEEIKKQRKSVFQIITMASIIEKEVRSINDMKIVSGIFWNRINYGIPLQADATLSYIFDDKVSAHSLDDLKIDSPYNSYKYRGLPPGPISNPGLNAILAAIYPEPTEYLYFLSDPATGQTVFGRTLEEHNANKFKYLK